MKNSKYIFLLLISTFIFSCSTEEAIEDDINSQTLLFENEISQRITTNRNDFLQSDDAFELENKMQWVSYITAQVLKESARARNEFIEELNNSNTPKVLFLESMLNYPNDRKYFFSEFKRVFLRNYISPGSCSGAKPEGGPHPNGELGGRSTIDYNQVFEDYLSSILNDDCLEYYLPNGFAYFESTGTGNNSSPIKSTAHPLNTSASNDGYLLDYNHGLCGVEEIDLVDSEPGFIIVVRPFRSPNCFYDEYDFEFDEFLN